MNKNKKYKVLYVKGFPDQLHVDIKCEAAKRKLSLKDFIIETMAKELRGHSSDGRATE